MARSVKKPANKSTKQSKKSVKKTSPEVLREMLDIEPRTADEAYQRNKENVMRALGGLRVARVEVEYDGSGDSGSVQGVTFYDEQDKTIDSVLVRNQIQFYHVYSSYSDGDYTAKISKEQKSINDVFENLAEKFLDDEGIDWYNNDGGYGVCVFDFETGKVTLKHEARITDTEYSEHEKKW